jgi:HTH-type transcriptional repressor of NAD biosynthesis genes
MFAVMQATGRGNLEVKQSPLTGRYEMKEARAFILMTAMPPTKGHLNLIKFGASLASEVYVIVCTQPGEPFADERFHAIQTAAKRVSPYGIKVAHMHRELPQDPETPGFWDMWQRIMKNPSYYMPFFAYGVEPGDYIVSSEPYGKRLAELTGATFMVYDPDREMTPVKATPVREDMLKNFDSILPEFQHNLRTDVVIFGAESTGKTTLAKELAATINGHFFFEWARPYLETVGPDITIDSMTNIWKGQTALQVHSYDFYDKPYAVFDTDLYSTIGYWEQPHWEAELGPVPEELIKDAYRLKADLYIITKSNIPFEEDPIRYGGDRRESPDEYWIGIAEKYDLPYVVLDSNNRIERVSWAGHYALQVAKQKAKMIEYDRGGF